MRFSRANFFGKFFLSSRASSWVHPSVDAGTDAFEKHAGFIGANLIAGSLALVGAPVALAVGVQMDPLVVSLMICLASPLVWAWWASKSGNLAGAAKGSLLSVSALIALFMIASGGVTATALALLTIVPVEAALRGDAIRLRFGFFCVLASIAAAAFFSTSSSSVIAPSSAHIIAAGAFILYMASLAARIKNLRTRAQSLLSSEQERFRLLAQNVNDLVTRHDVEGATLFSSPGARSLMGVKASALLKSGFLEQIHLQDRIHFLRGLSAAVHDGRNSQIQLRVRCKGTDNQVWKWVETRLRPFEGQSGKAQSVVAITRDISESKSQELALQQAAERSESAHQAQRRFITTMSHELRTPLNAILGFSDMLRQELFGPLPDKRQAEYVGLIHDSGQHLLQVVNDMLDMSRIEAGRYNLTIQSFHPSEITSATIKMLEPMAESNQVSVCADADDALPEMVADKRACQQILINLLSNAIKFTPAGGAVRVSARQHGRSIKFRVKDTGIGMDEAFLAKLGQPFTQADHGLDRAFEGTGLGLTVVKGLIELHKGEFDVVSAREQGTTITVTLPLKSAANRPVPADQNEQIVRIDGAVRSRANAQLPTPQLKSTTSQTNENEGDNRARVSA